MTVLVVALVVALVVWLGVRRHRRRTVLAGLEATRPTFMVEPPRRRLGSIRDEML